MDFLTSFVSVGHGSRAGACDWPIFLFTFFHIMTRPPVVDRFSLSRGIDPRGQSCVKLDTDVRSTEAPGFRMPLPAVPRWSEILRHLQRIACEPVP